MKKEVPPNIETEKRYVYKAMADVQVDATGKSKVVSVLKDDAYAAFYALREEARRQYPDVFPADSKITLYDIEIIQMDTEDDHEPVAAIQSHTEEDLRIDELPLFFEEYHSSD